MLLVAALIAGLAPATSRSVELRWSAPAQCPDQAAVERELKSLDGSVRLDPDAPILVEAVVSLQDEGFVLDIQFTGPGDRPPQRLHGRSCETLARATALITLDVASAAMLPEPSGETAPSTATQAEFVPPPELATQREPEHPPETTPLAQQPALPEAARTPGGQLVLTLATGPWLGLLPTPAATLLARAGWNAGRWTVEGSGGHAFRTTESIVGAAELSVRLTYGGLRGCYALAKGDRLSASGCLGVQMGALYSEPNDDVSSGVRNRSLWVGANGGAVLAWQIRPRLSLALEGIAVVHARRPGVYWSIGSSQETVFRTSLASGVVLFGPRLHLP